MTFILFASGYAQSNEGVFGSTYKLVKGYSKVPSDGIYLIAGYFSEKKWWRKSLPNVFRQSK